MPIPLIIWGGAALLGTVGGIAWAGKEAGKEIGKETGKAIPYLLAGTAIYLVIKDQKL